MRFAVAAEGFDGGTLEHRVAEVDAAVDQADGARRIPATRRFGSAPATRLASDLQRRAARVHMVEIIGAGGIERPQPCQRLLRRHVRRHAQYHERLAQFLEAFFAYDLETEARRFIQGRSDRRRGQDLAPHHRFAMRIGFQLLAVAPQERLDGIEAQGAQVARHATLEQAFGRTCQAVQSAKGLGQVQTWQAQLGLGAAGPAQQQRAGQAAEAFCGGRKESHGRDHK
jgi:hypothetical protein